MCHCIKALLKSSSKKCEASSKSALVPLSFVRSVTVSILNWGPALRILKHPLNRPGCHLSDLSLYQALRASSKKCYRTGCHCHLSVRIEPLLRASSKYCEASSKSSWLTFVKTIRRGQLYVLRSILQIALGAICHICHCIKPLLRSSSK
jgi:hypothetical protein